MQLSAEAHTWPPSVANGAAAKTRHRYSSFEDHTATADGIVVYEAATAGAHSKTSPMKAVHDRLRSECRYFGSQQMQLILQLPYTKRC